MSSLQWSGAKQAFRMRRDTDQDRYENRHLRHFVLFYQMHSPKLRLYWKKEGREGKTDKLLRTPYNHWSMHGLNQCNLQMLTAFTDINFSYANSFIIFHNEKKLWKISKKKDMINRTPSIVKPVNNILKYKESFIFTGTLKNLLSFFSCFLPHIFRKIFKILSMDTVNGWCTVLGVLDTSRYRTQELLVLEFVPCNS